MKKSLLLFLILPLLIFLGISCNHRPTDPLDTAREFIRYSLDGNYDEAKKLVYADTTNLFMINKLSDDYKTRMSDEDKKGYKDASIIINEVSNVSDSVVIVNYSNSFKRKPLPLKVIFKDGLWQVDLNYTFTGNL
jgi:hypothetical protein